MIKIKDADRANLLFPVGGSRPAASYPTPATARAHTCTRTQGLQNFGKRVHCLPQGVRRPSVPQVGANDFGELNFKQVIASYVHNGIVHADLL